MNHTNNKYQLLPLLLVILIDGMGLSVIFPMLSPLIIDPSSNILPETTSLQWRYFYYNLNILSFMIAWFFGSVLLGHLSDLLGRKKSLIISLVGFTIGFLLMAMGVVSQLFWILVLGRVVTGFMAGNQSIALAGAIDICEPNNRSRYLGYVQFSSSLGSLVGPMIGGFLTDRSIAHWFSYSTPFIFSAIITMLNFSLIYFFYQEIPINNHREKIKLKKTADLFSAAFKVSKIRHLSMVALFIMLGWSSYYTTISLFLSDQFGYTPIDIASYLSVSAIGFFLGTTYLLNILRQALRNSLIVIIGLVLASISIALTLTTENFYVLCALSIFLTCGFSLAYTTLLAMFSHTVSDAKQGWIMGIVQAITAFAFTLMCIIEAIVNYYSQEATVIMSVLMLLIAMMLIFPWRRNLVGEN